jgi:hypothetical protein
MYAPKLLLMKQLQSDRFSLGSVQYKIAEQCRKVPSNRNRMP